MPSVALTVILLVLLRNQKQQMANIAIDQGQHLPNEAEGTSPVDAHLRGNRRNPTGQTKPTCARNLRRKGNE